MSTRRYEFLLGMTIWYIILFSVNWVSRENGFENTFISAK